jgi:hypothetical protein
MSAYCTCGHSLKNHMFHSTAVSPCKDLNCDCGVFELRGDTGESGVSDGTDKCVRRSCFASSRAFAKDKTVAKYEQLCRLCYLDLSDVEKDEYVLVTLASTKDCKCMHAAKDHAQPSSRDASSHCKETFCNCVNYRAKTPADPGG